MHKTGEFYRPPTEADTPLLEVTYGCAWNKCSFCNMYQKTKFGVSPLKDIKEDLEELKTHNPEGIERIFITNGDSFILPTENLIKISELIQKYFPDIKTISSYASINSIKEKSEEELKKISDYHYNDLYIGLESGCDKVLKLLNKGFDKHEEKSSLQKLEDAGIDYNALIMLGAGGHEYSKQHIKESVQLVNRYKPKILSLLSTTINENTVLNEMVKEGSFTPLTEKEMIEEELLFLKTVEFDDEAYFFGNHVFNTISATGYFKHKDFIIDYIEEEYNRLMSEKEEMMNSVFNTYPKKRGGFLFI